ncbi:MAG: hypothetical protein C4306_03990, partial [Thermoleophilia bacterium]
MRRAAPHGRAAYLALLGLGALDAAGYGVIAPVVPEIAERTGVGPGVMGLLVTTFGLGQLAGYPLAGVGIRRLGATPILAVSLFLTAAGAVGFAAGDGLAAWFPARALQGVAAGGLWMGVVFSILERWPGEEYRRLSSILAAYSIGGVAGPALGAVGGVAGPFLAHLGLVLAGGGALALAGTPASRPRFASDRAALRTPGFVLASAGVLLVALAIGVLEGPVPLHLGEELSQQEIAALYVGTSIVVGITALATGRAPARAGLALGAILIPVGVGAVGIADTPAAWVAALAAAAIGFGAGETGALGVLLGAVGAQRMVLAMVVWSQVWAIGYLGGPALAGGVAESL